MTRVSFQRSAAGSALISTLLVIVVLSIIVVAFLQSMSTERQTARSYMNKHSAELAAEAAYSAGVNKLRTLIQSYPDSVTVWEPNMSSNAACPTPGTALYFFKSDAIKIAPGANLPSMFFLPLVSGASEVNVPAGGDNAVASSNYKTSALQALTSENSININSDASRWIGIFPTNSPSLAANKNSDIYVPWVDLKIKNPQGKDVPVARYAYWIEDESFRLNINVLGAQSRGASTQGDKTSQIPLQGLSDNMQTPPSGWPNSFFTTRSSIPGSNNRFLTPSEVYYSTSTSVDDLSGESLDFLTTIHSAGSLLSRSGAHRQLINRLVTNTTTQATIEDEVKSIKDAIVDQAPEFGQRFFFNASTNLDNPGASTTEKDTYLTKLAANIRDYIDPDSQPTIIYQSGVTPPAGMPQTAGGIPGSTNDFIAMGKEAIPRLMEVLMRAWQTDMGSGKNYEVHLSYYFKFWNPYTKDINVSNLGTNPRIRIINQPGWIDTNNGTIVVPEGKSRDREIALNSLTSSSFGSLTSFPAGQITTITNDSSSGTLETSGTVAVLKSGEAAKIYSSNSEEVLTGTLKGNGWGGIPTLALRTRTISASGPSSPGQDFLTEFVLGNNSGYLDSYPQSLPIPIGILVDHYNSYKSNKQQAHQRGGYLRGNSSGGTGTATMDQVGDPSALNESLTLSPSNNTSSYNAAGSSTCFLTIRDPGTSQSQADFNQRSALASFNPAGAALKRYMPNAGTVRWPEGTDSITPILSSTSNPGSALYYIRDDKMVSIGELGYIYDPRRAYTNKQLARGGARTLRVGSPETISSSPVLNDAVWDGKAYSLSRSWAAWRLADIFSSAQPSDPAQQIDESTSEGTININGALRDGGLAIKAALQGYIFSNDTETADPTLKNKNLDKDAITAFAQSLVTRLQDVSKLPLLERGEISELSALNSSSFAGNDFQMSAAKISDRGREELVRRNIELFTTRGTIFSIYVVGQSLNSQGNPTSIAKRKITFQLKPVFAASAGKFDKPDHYDVIILQDSPFR